VTTLTGPGAAMAAEIAEQPHVLRQRLIDRERIHHGVRRLVPDPLHGIAVLGRGSSGTALVFARYALELAARRPVTVVAPSVHRLYGVTVDYAGYLAIAASQSGRTPEIVEAAGRLRAGGATTIALTNDPASPLAGMSDLVVPLGAGPEAAVPATKTFTAQVAVAAMIAEALGPVPWAAADWPAAIGAVEAAVIDAEPVGRAVERLAGVQRLASVGRGLTLCLAQEASLKLQETARVAVTWHSAASFRHGPIAAAAPDFPVLAWGARGPSGADVSRLVDQLRRSGIPTITVGPGSDGDVPVPGSLPDGLAVLPAAVRLQQLALQLGLERGHNPDAPPGLGKVTLS
jgi:glucosamine--fructose-6-phosphate aminotransferase (isomerizing)